MSRRNLSRFSITSPIIYQSESGSEPEYPEPAFQEVEKQEQEQKEEEEKEIIASLERRNEETGKKKAPLNLSLKKVCKLCKEKGHQAGYFGATYIDCPNRPCFLCKDPGHFTVSCPRRLATEHGVILAGKGNHSTSMDLVFGRQLGIKTQKLKPSFVIPNGVVNGSIEHHSSRTVTLEFHPSKDTVIVSGDRDGEVGIWNYGIIDGKTIYDSIHTCEVNHIKFNVTNDGTFYTSSTDRTICCIDLKTGLHNTLIDRKTGSSMLHAMDIHAEKNLVLAADGIGYIHLIDRRSGNRVENRILIHRRYSTIFGLQCNPLQPDILLSCGNDHFARIWDIRRLEYKSSLASLAHGRVVNSAYFSPHTGNKILTTSRDNIIRVWDSIFGNLESPSREIVHSHDSNGHMTSFKAEWDPNARIWDIRRLEYKSSLASLAHGRVVNSAYFSPHTGNKILTTSRDNRIRVWDSIFGNLESPSREIVHSHDSNGHMTSFKAEWDPKDFSESLAVIGRYMRVKYNGVALHPIDFIDTSTGKLVAEVIEQGATTAMSPVNKLHPRDDVMASGSSSSIYIWTPDQEDTDSEKEQDDGCWLSSAKDERDNLF